MTPVISTVGDFWVEEFVYEMNRYLFKLKSY